MPDQTEKDFDQRVLATLRALPALADVTVEFAAPVLVGGKLAPESAGVRVTHPSGAQVVCEETRSQLQNQVMALLGVLAQLQASESR